MYQHFHGVDLVSDRFSSTSLLFIYFLDIIDLKLDYNTENNEIIRVPIDIYEKACITDAAEGLKVKQVYNFN